MIPTVGHYWRIYRTFFKSSLTREMMFRVNFFAKILQNTVWFFFFIVILLVVFGRVKQIGGWNRDEAFILTATMFVVNSINNALTFSLMEIPDHVRKGTLDFIITKPVDSQFWVSARKFNFNELGSFCAGIGLIIVSLRGLENTPSIGQLALYLIGLFSACGILYGFQLCLMTLGIYFIRIDNLWVLGDTIVGLSRYPQEIFTRSLRYFFTYALPISFLAYIPASQLVRTPSLSMAVLSVVYAIALVLIARLFWRYSLRHYSSASS